MTTDVDVIVGAYTIPTACKDIADALEAHLKEIGEWETTTDYYVRQDSLGWINIVQLRRREFYNPATDASRLGQKWERQ